VNSPFLVTCSDYQKRHQLTPHYGWLWTLVQTVNRTSGRSGSASVDDPAERGCSRSRTTLGSVPSTSGEDRTWLQVLEGATTRGGQAFQWVSVSELLELCYISRNDPVFLEAQSCLDSTPHPLVNPYLSSSPLSSSITLSLFYSMLKTYLFNKTFPP